MTLAEQWRQTKPRDFKSASEYALTLQRHDLKCSVQKTDLGIVIDFSDGSRHLMGSTDLIQL